MERDGRAGVEVDLAEKRFGETPLIQAAVQGFDAFVRVLLQHGADPNKSRNDGVTPLHVAAQCGHPKVASLLIEKRANIKKVNDHKRTPIKMAAVMGHVTIVHLLLEHAADTTIKDHWETILCRQRAPEDTTR